MSKSELQHTPGEWKVVDLGCSLSIRSKERGNVVATISVGSNIAANRADARLISQLPQMLDMLAANAKLFRKLSDVMAKTKELSGSSLKNIASDFSFVAADIEKMVESATQPENISIN